MADFEPVTDHILRLELEWKVGGIAPVPVSVWLLQGSNGWTLVDTGPPQSADRLVAAIVRATGGQGIQRVLLTHGHYDHAGGLTALRLAWSPPVLCHALEVPFVTGEMRYRELTPKHWGFWIGRFLMAEGEVRVPVARDLEAGQAIEGMAVIHLPGHSPGQIGLLHPSDRAMICGDAVMNLRGRLSPPFSFASPDPAAVRASMRRLGELDYDHLLPSHGPAIRDGGREAVLAFLMRRGVPALPA